MTTMRHNSGHTPAYLAVRTAARFVTLTTIVAAFFLLPTTLAAGVAAVLGW